MSEGCGFESTGDPMEEVRMIAQKSVLDIATQRNYPVIPGIGRAAFIHALSAMGLYVQETPDSIALVYRRSLVSTSRSSLGTLADVTQEPAYSFNNFCYSFANLYVSYDEARHPTTNMNARNSRIQSRIDEFKAAFTQALEEEVTQYGEGVLFSDECHPRTPKLRQVAFTDALDRFHIPMFIRSMEFGGYANGPTDAKALIRYDSRWYSSSQNDIPRERAMKSYFRGIFLSELIRHKGFTPRTDLAPRYLDVLQQSHAVRQEYMDEMCIEYGVNLLEPGNQAFLHAGASPNATRNRNDPPQMPSYNPKVN